MWRGGIRRFWCFNTCKNLSITHARTFIFTLFSNHRGIFLYRNKYSRNELHLQPLWHTRWWLQALDFKIDNVITNLKNCSTYTMMPLSERNSHLLMGTLISLTVYYECSCGGGHCNECFPCEDSRNTVIKLTKDFL